MKTKRGYKFTEQVFVFILIAIIPIIRTSQTLDPQTQVQFISLTIFLLVLTGVFILKSKIFAVKNRLIISFISLFAVYIIYSMLTAIVTSNPADAIFILSKHILFFILLVSFLYLKPTETLFKRAMRSGVILVLVIGIPACIQFISLIIEGALVIPYDTYNITSLFLHRNLLSEVLLLLIPFCVYSFFVERGTWRIIALISFNLSVFLTISLSNRATWLALIAMGTVYLLSLLIKKQHPLRTRLQRLFIGNTVAVLLLVILFYALFSNTSSVKTHSLNSLDFTQGSTKDRIELWTRTVKLIGEKPIIGSGLASWKIEMLKYGNEGLASEDNTTYYQRPHNDFLWVAAEQGIIGVVLFLALFAFLLLHLSRDLIRLNEVKSKQRLLVILLVTVGYLVISFFSFPKERISHMVILFAVWGLYLNLKNVTEDSNNKKELTLKWVPVLSLVVLVAILLVGLKRVNGEIHAKKAILSKKELNYRNCIREVRKAESFLYKIDATSTPLNWYSGLSYFKLKNYEKAAGELEKALRVNPYHIYTLNDYAGSLTKLNRQAEAKVMYKKAINVAPNFLSPKLNLCALYYNEGKLSEAFELLKTTDTTNSSPRYEKTVVAVINGIVAKELKAKQLNQAFIHLYNNEKQNLSFYRTCLVIAQENNLQSDEFSKLFEFYTSLTSNNTHYEKTNSY